MGGDSDRQANPWLILPTWGYVWLGVLGGLALLLVVAGAAAKAPGYEGIDEQSSAREICAHRTLAIRDGGRVAGCSTQLSNRAAQFTDAAEDIDVACARRTRLLAELADKTEGSTRKTLADEQAEIVRLQAQIRELAGPTVWAAVVGQLILILITVLLAVGTILCAGRHARAVGIPRLRSFAGAGRPFFRSMVAALGVAVLVTLWESLDAHKTGFDWSSYCIAGPLTLGGWSTSRVAGLAFWFEHATQGALAALVGLQVVVGWHVTKLEYAPTPDPEKPHWGLRSYVTFLQVWCFSIIVIVGLVTAAWIHGLAASRTNIQTFFIGFGALPSVIWIVARLLRNALALRRECEERRSRAEDPDKLPPDPTDGLLSVSWWQVPTLFASAYAIAAALLGWGGVGRLFGGR